MNHARRPGFTLIELLVVIAMLALLMAITMPALSAARRIAKRTACGTNLHSIGQAVQAYLSAHKDYYPFISQWPPVEEEVAGLEGRDPYPSMPEALGTEVSHAGKVFKCPADRVLLDEQNKGKRYFYLRYQRHNKNGELEERTVGTSYEWNPWFSGKKVGRDVFTNQAGLSMGPWDVPMAYDYEPFHGRVNQHGSMMTLFADFHVDADTYSTE
jgi:prepilin-type N-terminal cleavage/methylation domain-containing protein